MVSQTIASYLPESMLITIGPDLRILDESGVAIPFPSSAAASYFFHEYVHYLHNLSTLSGAAAFANTLELWRRFRFTLDESGYSIGSQIASDQNGRHLTTLLEYLASIRRPQKAPETFGTMDVARVQSISLEHEVLSENNEPLHSIVKCDVESSGRGVPQSAVARIGTLELLENAAWLLEKKMDETLNSKFSPSPPPFFPYRIAQAAIEYTSAGANEDDALACILAALQSSNAPEAFFDLLENALAGEPINAEALRAKAAGVLSKCKPLLEKKFSELEAEFSGEGAMAKAIRHIVKLMRDGFVKREGDPFFEQELIEAIRAKETTLDEILLEFPPCAVRQVNPGSNEELLRDFLLVFGATPRDDCDDIASFLRVVQCMFHWVNTHRTRDRLVETAKAAPLPCSYFTCCDLTLRRENPSVCQKHPWDSANWNWGGGACWYGTAVKITRPPNEV